MGRTRVLRNPPIRYRPPRYSRLFIDPGVFPSRIAREHGDYQVDLVRREPTEPGESDKSSAGWSPARRGCIIRRYQRIWSRERMSVIFRNLSPSLLTVNLTSSLGIHGEPNDSLRLDCNTPSADIITMIYSYANSVLQALYFCNPFRELLLQLADPSAPPEPLIPQTHQTAQSPNPVTTVRKKPERKFSVNDARGTSESSPNNAPKLSGPHIPSTPRTLSSALRSLFVHISKHPGDKGTVAPRAFIEKLKELNELFRSSMHQDAHEFLNYLLNRIVEETEEGRKSAPESDRKLRLSLLSA